MIDPATGWFEITEITTFELDEATGGNYEYIDRSSDRVRQLSNEKWLSRYLRPLKVVFDKISEFKQNFSPLLKGFDMKPVLMTI